MSTSSRSELLDEGSDPRNQDPGRHHQRERQIRTLEHSCGCTSGMILMLAGVAGYVLYLLRAAPSDLGQGRRWLTGLGIALAGAVVGKLAGLLWARIRLARLRRASSI